jgi:Pyruvate:ferredoxin oxidoreductase and related 2-oxoacid:ferredoxin oxidoreductases, beta subunit
MAMHGVPYVATASIAYPQDFYRKLKRASEIEGFKFIHLHAPCPPGWRYDPAKTVEIAKLAVETGAWILWEYDNGQLKLNPPSTVYVDRAKRKPLKEYLKLQGRFAHLTDNDVKMLEEEIEAKWQTVLALAKAFPQRL